MDPAALLDRLAHDGFTLAVAESCTGGLLGARITSVPGASRVFRGGIIAYHDDVKARLLDVEPEKFEHGAVSATVAEDMAHGLRDRMGTDINVAVTGIAGPGGGTDSKPVGTVWIAVLGPAGVINAHKHIFDGDRDAVREQTVAAALAAVESNVIEAEREAAA